jgi:hypothetical protein
LDPKQEVYESVHGNAEKESALQELNSKIMETDEA